MIPPKILPNNYDTASLHPRITIIPTIYPQKFKKKLLTGGGQS